MSEISGLGQRKIHCLGSRQVLPPNEDKSKEEIENWIKCLYKKDGSLETRRAAAESLAEFGLKAITTLTQFENDDDPSIRYFATRGIEDVQKVQRLLH